jgi:hypothetical protein
MNRVGELKCIVIDSPYDLILNNNFPNDVYSKVSSLKIKGYLQEHSYGVLPFDGTEEISTHILLCEIIDGIATPILGFKSISKKKCLQHHTRLPVLSLLDNSNALKQKSVVDDLISRQENIAYESTCTAFPRNDLRDKHAISAKEIITALTYSFHHDRGTQALISLATPRFKIDNLFKSWGYQVASSEGKIIPSFPYKCLAGELVQLYIHHGEWGQYAMEMGIKYKALWDSRIEYSNKEETINIAA